MRQTCELSYVIPETGERYVCGKPAVDFVMRIDASEEYKMWLCAEHFDSLERIRQILRERDQEKEL